ncbi:MAG: FecR domain-containing protein [Flavitalea sp.]
MLTNENDMNDDLLVSYLLKEDSQDNRKQVERWISASAANQRYFEHFRLIWETSLHIDLPPAINENDAWDRFQQRTKKAQLMPAVVRPLTSSLKWMRIAAILLISVGAAGLSYFIFTRYVYNEKIFASNGIIALKQLPDGSEVTLNKHSAITYNSASNGNPRKVQLKGEAFFKVTPDKFKPFTVNINDVTITVLGTSFNVKNINGQTEVVVETGIVKVARKNDSVILVAHEKVLVPATDSLFAKQENADKLYNYYRSKEFVCDNTPLWKLVEILNEAYESKIIIAREELRNYPITTTFYNEPLNNILSVIAETFNITVERRGDELLLK